MSLTALNEFVETLNSWAEDNVVVREFTAVGDGEYDVTLSVCYCHPHRMDFQFLWTAGPSAPDDWRLSPHEFVHISTAADFWMCIFWELALRNPDEPGLYREEEIWQQ